ncbi:hypothetical protein SK128_028381, partial [Halocaridina rubra]
KTTWSHHDSTQFDLFGRVKGQTSKEMTYYADMAKKKGMNIKHFDLQQPSVGISLTRSVITCLLKVT